MRTAHLTRHLMAIVVTVTAMVILDAPAVSAHGEDDASTSHALLELARYAAAVAIVLAVVLGLFWVRARVARRRP